MQLSEFKTVILPVAFDNGHDLLELCGSALCHHLCSVSENITPRSIPAICHSRF